MVRKTLRKAALLGRLRRFGRQDDGSAVIFAMFILVMMLIVAGMAVDFMRFETYRARLQATLDRAVLAAADLEQTLPAEEVVRDYFEKAGLLDELTSVTVTENVNARTVNATAEMGVNMTFLRLVGIEELAAPANGTATEQVSDLEIVLVLDVSGSMVQGGSQKLNNLKGAAQDFVEQVFAGDVENRISIGIVPFNGQVNLPAPMRSWYTGVTQVVTTLGIVATPSNANYVPTAVNCVDLPTGVYSTQTIARSTVMAATAWADTFTGVTRSNAYQAPGTPVTNLGSTPGAGRPSPVNRWCPDVAANTILLPTRSETALDAKINGLVGVGATSINAGMRWGMTLLDPGARDMFTAMIAAGQLPAGMSGRPFDYDRPETLKIVVLMTDGRHYPEERVNAAYRSGISPIFRSTGDGNYSIFHAARAGTAKHWVPHLSAWRTTPWNSGAGVTQLSWPQVWSELRMRWVSWQLYTRAMGGNSTAWDDAQMNLFRTRTDVVDNTPTMDAQLATMCDRARENGVVVYGIAFEAPPAGQDAIFDCASSPAHYYEPVGAEIGDTFDSIAAQINALRLTQ